MFSMGLFSHVGLSLLTPSASLWGLLEERKLLSSMPGERLAIQHQTSASAQPRSPTRIQGVPRHGSKGSVGSLPVQEVRKCFNVTLLGRPPLRKFYLVILYCCTQFISFLGLIMKHNKIYTHSFTCLLAAVCLLHESGSSLRPDVVPVCLLPWHAARLSEWPMDGKSLNDQLRDGGSLVVNTSLQG